MYKRIKIIIKDYSVILFGSLIYATAFDWLFVPNNIVMGGFTGLAQSLNHIFPIIPIGVLVIIMNIPLFIIGIRLQGIKLLFSSCFAMLTSSVFIDILSEFIVFHPMEDQLVACIFGGVLVGAALGILLLSGATTGGTELAATVLKYKFRHIQIDKLCLMIDLAIIAFYAVAFHALKEALYAAIAMFISSVVMNFVIYGRKNSKVACIVSGHGDELIRAFVEHGFGITELHAKGGFSHDDKKILICVFKSSKITLLKSLLNLIDPTAFVILCDAHEVFGEGFSKCDVNGL